ncbi:methyltransferase domain-containing protein (plasmid) [Bradyrhizobium sp. CCGUVB1N3]|uniref:protein-L-isoaspartate O-methyltransferase family protein n=1 Tax=Bradyrhizobium sp. CCGUVB1N3 TaxID=2949629 RepID=UPI0020B20817|nr:methyltransferase domain-containing protein [Bradyrhizobium sp. CCGUVB1N3]MCP3477763.1 methyltransferase domain-containing protein [Bradyrhizobium sp. CCGUVB1N3]
MDDTLAAARRWYAEDLLYKTPLLQNPQLINAFASVPRELFVGPGPWRIISDPYDNSAFLTPDTDPRWLYHDVLVTIDPNRNLNNGMPSFWARNLDHLHIARGERVLQVGAGTGYYSAVLAEIVGPFGRVTAVETDPALAAQAQANLANWPQVDVVAGDGRTVDVGELDIVVVFAGSTHPSRLWLDRLVEGGRLLMPLTSESRRGFLLRVVRRRNRFEASSIGGVAVYPCMRSKACRAARCRSARCTLMIPDLATWQKSGFKDPDFGSKEILSKWRPHPKVIGIGRNRTRHSRLAHCGPSQGAN